MTIADKIAALPEMPKYKDYIPGAGRSAFLDDSIFCYRARLSLLLETVRAMYDAEDAHEAHFALDKERDAQWDFYRPILYQAMMDADADLRILQAHLEGERT